MGGDSPTRGVESGEACFFGISEPKITTDYCVDDTLTLLVARGEARRAIEVGHEFFHGKLVRLHFLVPQQINRSWILFQQRAAGWSFTDCTSNIVVDDLGIKTASALDEHFWEFGDVTIVP
jgi:predicted nucleic acid-binding protein